MPNWKPLKNGLNLYNKLFSYNNFHCFCFNIDKNIPIIHNALKQKQHYILCSNTLPIFKLYSNIFQNNPEATINIFLHLKLQVLYTQVFLCTKEATRNFGKFSPTMTAFCILVRWRMTPFKYKDVKFFSHTVWIFFYKVTIYIVYLFLISQMLLVLNGSE